jgi:hypothetical protein
MPTAIYNGHAPKMPHEFCDECEGCRPAIMDGKSKCCH